MSDLDLSAEIRQIRGTFATISAVSDLPKLEKEIAQLEIEAQEPVTEVIEQPVSQEDDRAGEFFLREVLGATPIKSDDN